MKINLKYILAFFISASILVSCSSDSEFLKKTSLKDLFIIWAHSDIQPREEAEYTYYEKAVDDINRNIPGAKISIVAGDIIHWSRSAKIYQWYNKTKAKSYIKHWYEIAGNHDQKDYEGYKKYIKRPLHYSVKVGNILILLMSDENKAAQTVISDNVFKWWKDKVINNQDKIIITVTHAYLKQSGLVGALESTRNIEDSYRFADVLEKYKVDLWLCGHAHIPYWIKSRVKIQNSLGGTLFINISAIRGNIFKNPESSIIYFKKNSDRILIKSRDHEDEEFNNWFDIDFTLNHKFIWDNSEPLVEAMKQGQ